jgi:hypothetical protein
LPTHHSAAAIHVVSIVMRVSAKIRNNGVAGKRFFPGQSSNPATVGFFAKGSHVQEGVRCYTFKLKKKLFSNTEKLNHL